MTPQDVSDLAAADKIRDLFRQKQDMQAVCYCMGDGLEEVKKASSVSKNIVVSPTAIATAQYLEKYSERRMRSLIRWWRNCFRRWIIQIKKSWSYISR